MVKILPWKEYTMDEMLDLMDVAVDERKEEELEEWSKKNSKM